MASILNDILSEKTSIDDFKTWLTLDSEEKANFILYFLNFVKENCSWLISKSGKGIESPSIKSSRSDQQVCTNKTEKKLDRQILRKENPVSSTTYSKLCLQENELNDFNRTNYGSHNIAIQIEDANLKRRRSDYNNRKSDHSARKSLTFNHPRHIKSTAQGKVRNDQLVPDFTSLDAFPPVGCKNNEIVSDCKAKRRITPTPVREIQQGSSKFGNPRFISESEQVPSEFSKPAPIVEMPSSDFKSEREMLKLTRKQITNAGTLPYNFCNLKIKSNISPAKSDVSFVIPDPEEVTCCDKLEKFSDIYSILISYAFVPNVTSELYFIFELITSTAVPGEKPDKKNCVFCSVHNCVSFAVSVLNKLRWLLHLLDTCTLQSLKEIPFLVKFSPPFIEYLQSCCNDVEEVSTKSQSLNRVPFILEEDSIKNFIDNNSFTSFRKQRDLFYEILRDWQQQPFGATDSKFDDSFNRKAKNLINIAPNSVNLQHLAKLIQSQMTAGCLGLEAHEIYDEFLRNTEKNFPGRIEKLHQRFMTPYLVGGPSPAPSFYGAQVFFSELIKAASSATLNQHLEDIILTKIQELNNADIFSDSELSSMATLREEYAFALHTLRLLGKFLGFLHFLPYKVCGPLSTNIINQQLTFRKNSAPLIDTSNLLKSALEKKRLILTVPWIVEYLSMIDLVGINLPHIEETLKILNAVYHEKCFFETKSYNFWFLRLMIGWLFEVLCYPVKCSYLALPITLDTCQNKGIDFLILVNKQLIHACCPYLVEFKILVYSFLNGIKKDKKKEARKITPLSTTKLGPTKSAEQQIQSQLEENFFFLHPPSLKRTVDFLSERMASKFIQKIRSEITDFKLQTVETVINNKEYKVLGRSPSKKGKESFIDSYILKLYETSLSKVDELVQVECQKHIESILPSLLSDDIKPPVLKMCCNIAFRLAREKITQWCDVNLIFKDIKQDIKNKINHMSKGDSENVSDDDFNLSSLLNLIRDNILKNLSGIKDPSVAQTPLLLEVHSMMNKPIGRSTKQLLVYLVIDLYMSILVNAPEEISLDFDKNFISVLYECPQNFNLEDYFMGSHNIKLIVTGKNVDSSCKKLDCIITELINKKLFSMNQLKKCLKNLNLYEWHDSKAKLILESLSLTLSKFGSDDKVK